MNIKRERHCLVTSSKDFFLIKDKKYLHMNNIEMNISLKEFNMKKPRSYSLEIEYDSTKPFDYQKNMLKDEFIEKTKYNSSESKESNIKSSRKKTVLRLQDNVDSKIETVIKPGNSKEQLSRNLKIVKSNEKNDKISEVAQNNKKEKTKKNKSETEKKTSIKESNDKKPKLAKNYSFSNLFGFSKDKSNSNNQTSQRHTKNQKNSEESNNPSTNSKEKTLIKAPSFKDMWEAFSTFSKHSNFSSKLSSNHNSKKLNMKKTKFLELGSLQFNHFHFLKKIGSGAFGNVYLCKHKVTNETVVIKVLEKSFIVQRKQEEHVMEEKEVLKLLYQHDCPFTVKALASFQDPKRLYFVMEHISGGELIAHLYSSRFHRFSEKKARYYVCELIVALKCMHEKEHIVYRDIKPENMLLDKDGHLKLVDFGFAKHLAQEEKTYTFCGTPDYLAPEVIQGLGYNYEADLWSLGVFIYELVVGHAPFSIKYFDATTINFETILSGQFKLPSFLSPSVKDLIVSLLQVDRRCRLGSENGISDVMNHFWFSSVEWNKVLNKLVKPPKRHSWKKGLVSLKQKIKTPSCCEEEVDQALFSHFDFNVETESDLSDEKNETNNAQISNTEIYSNTSQKNNTNNKIENQKEIYKSNQNCTTRPRSNSETKLHFYLD